MIDCLSFGENIHEIICKLKKIQKEMQCLENIHFIKIIEIFEYSDKHQDSNEFEYSEEEKESDSWFILNSNSSTQFVNTNSGIVIFIKNYYL